MREGGAGVYAHTLTQTDMQVITERLLKGNFNSSYFLLRRRYIHALNNPLPTSDISFDNFCMFTNVTV